MTTEISTHVYDGAGALSTDLSHMSSVFSLGAMPENEFGIRLKLLKVAVTRAEAIKRELMTPDVDYGIIPGLSKKPTLLKPGAEKLCSFFGLVPEFEKVITLGEDGQPEIRVVTTCLLHQGSASGPIVGSGVGSSNSWEKRYRYRQGDRTCPVCGVNGAIRQAKGENGAWYCWKKLGGCNANFRHNDKRILDQAIGIIENPDPMDLENTIIKISFKRAYVDATLRTTATSGLFTQDIEDMTPSAPVASPPMPEADLAAQPISDMPPDEIVEGEIVVSESALPETPIGQNEITDRAIALIRLEEYIGQADFSFEKVKALVKSHYHKDWADLSMTEIQEVRSKLEKNKKKKEGQSSGN